MKKNYNYLKRTLGVLFLLLLINVFNTNAQTDSLDYIDMSLEELLDIEVSGVSRYAQDLSDVPNSIHVVTHQQIIDRGYFDLSDVMKDVQGFDISANAGRFGEFYSLRGIAGNDRFLILINGHKLNAATGIFMSIGNSISIRHAERIEFIYGPASAVYGADAFSGLINIVFNNAADNESNMNASAYINYGSFNSIDGAIQTSVKINDDLSFNLSARMFKSDGPDYFVGRNDVFDIINTYVPPITNEVAQPINDHNIYFNVQYKNLSLNYYRTQFDQGNGLGMHPGFYIYDDLNKWITSTDFVWLSYDKKLQNDASLIVDLSFKSHVQNNNTMFHKWGIPFVVGNTYEQFLTGKDKTIHGVITYNQTISDKLQFILGVDNEYTYGIPPYANDQLFGSSDKYEGTAAKLIDDEFNITDNRTSGFGQITYSPIDMIDLIIGARYDYSSRYEGAFNPRMGFILRPTSSTDINFIYGKAFQAPSLFYEYEQFGTPTIAMLSAKEVESTTPGWKIKNQIVNSYELSIKQKIGENIKLSIAAYYNDLSNLIERNVFAPLPVDSVYNKYFDSYTSGMRNENIGSQEIMGLDFNIDAKITNKIIFYSYYSYTDAVQTINDVESDIPRISNHKLWLGFTFQNIFNYVTISPRMRYMGDMFSLNTTAFPDNKQPGFYTIDLNLSVKNISKYFQFYVSLNNITDNEIDHGGLFNQDIPYTYSIPQAGFNFRAGIEVFLNK